MLPGNRMFFAEDAENTLEREQRLAKALEDGAWAGWAGAYLPRGGDGVEGGDPVQEARVEHGCVGVLGGVEAADGVTRDCRGASASKGTENEMGQTHPG